MDNGIEINNILEDEDGGAEISFEMEDAAVKNLCQYAINNLLAEVVEYELPMLKETNCRSCKFSTTDNCEQPCCSCDMAVCYDTVPNMWEKQNVLEKL